MMPVRAEFIKLLSTRSPKWTAGAIVAVTLFFVWLGLNIDEDSLLVATQGLDLSSKIAAIIAIVAITSDYRFGTLEVSLLATPSVKAYYFAKVVAASATALILAIISTLIFAIAITSKPPALIIDPAELARQVFGWIPVFIIVSIYGLAIGAIVRRTDYAIGVFASFFTLEALVGLVPNFGLIVRQFAPLAAADAFPLPASVLEQPAVSVFDNTPLPPVSLRPLEGIVVAIIWSVVLSWVAIRRIQLHTAFTSNLRSRPRDS